jgi:hypothetical protein
LGSDAGKKMRVISLATGQPVDTANFDQLAINILDAGHEIEVDREEGADRDQRDFRRLVDAQPEQQQRHPGQRWNGANRLEGRVEQCFRHSRDRPTAAPTDRGPGLRRWKIRSRHADELTPI